MIMMSSIKPIQVVHMNPNGSFSVMNASEAAKLDITQGDEKGSVSVTDPKDLPKNDIEAPCLNKNIPRNNWRDATQGVLIPVEEPIEALHYDPKEGHRLRQQQYAESERRAHEASNNNVIKLTSEMYDLMAQYGKKIGY